MIRVGWHVPNHTVGLGHRMHRLAIERAIERANVAHKIEVVPFSAVLPTGLDLVLVDVDLPEFGHSPKCDVWTLLRWMPERWCEKAFSGRPPRYRVITTEPIVAYMGDLAIDPIVVANPDECAALGIATPTTTAVIHSDWAEAELLASEFRDVLGPSPRMLVDSVKRTPAAPWRQHYRAIASAVGYNAFWESVWLDTMRNTHWKPMRGSRVISDQFTRAELIGHVERPAANGADTLVQLILGQFG